MMLVVPVLAALGTVLISYLGIGLFRRYSLKRDWVDIPNERSSHETPTPRGGGLVIAVTCLIAYPAICIFAPGTFSWGYYIGAILIVAVSWLDDLFSISVGWRLLVHFSAAILVVAADGYWQAVEIPATIIPFHWPGLIITIFWIVWVINAYNFMDGIDGMAGLQAVIAGFAWAFIGLENGAFGTFFFLIVLAGSCIGFLIHNWSPAKVFMGDVGSAFLGFTFATAPLILREEAGQPAHRLPVTAVLILWPFLFDTILTVFRRLFRNERVWTPHRDHLYQRLVITGREHATVSAIYGLFAVISGSAAILVLDWGGDIAFYLILLVLFLTLVFLALVFLFTPSPNQEKAAVQFGGSTPALNALQPREPAIGAEVENELL